MKNMKKLLCVALGAALSVSLLASCSGGSSSTPAPETTTPAETTPAETTPAETGAADLSSALIEDGKLIMSTNAQFPPYELVADGEGFNGTGFEGIDIEIAYALAEKLGLELVIDDMEFDSALLAVQNNAADMMLAGLSYSTDRDEVMDFSDSYATGVQVVIVKEGSDVTLDNLGEKTIGTQMGTTGFIYCTDDYGEDHVIGYETGAVAIQALVNGQIDAVVIDNLPAQSYVEANEGLTILDTEYAVEDYAIAVAKGNTALLEAVNAAMAELKADGTFQAIVDKYIKAE